MPLQVFELLENPTSPLETCKRLVPLLERVVALPSCTHTATAAVPLDVDLKSYTSGLQEAAVLRMLQQLQGVYSTMRFERLAAMVPFLPFDHIERMMVDASKYGLLRAKLDHRGRTVSFGSGVTDIQDLKQHLTTLAKGLSKALATIHPQLSGERARERDSAIQSYLADGEAEHAAALARKMVIEERKEEMERLLQEQEREAEARRQEQARLNEIAEQQRAETEKRRRELEAMQR